MMPCKRDVLLGCLDQCCLLSPAVSSRYCLSCAPISSAPLQLQRPCHQQGDGRWRLPNLCSLRGELCSDLDPCRLVFLQFTQSSNAHVQCPTSHSSPWPSGSLPAAVGRVFPSVWEHPVLQGRAPVAWQV